ncbi:NAD(P)/FAD-dependent oxidoreductase [Rhodovibrio salinarum]|uniref:FAD-dependent oxidoreductase n=1 Tax=Rhodovibrio salinarum TaxID=1087 RepID=A0A934V0Q2_9PROT|nr:FAD-dependent oxidoreductase [Rhodovibrio salinarum]MBK1697871.1 FAD-dependent oxidoreductase [Rhodovibrio salinarum]
MAGSKTHQQVDREAATPHTTPHVVIVGAGAVGVAAGLHLQLAGARVTLLDRGAPGEGATYANGAVIGEDHVVPVATPSVLTDLPRMLFNSKSPLAVRWSYLPKLTPWLWHFVKRARWSEVERVSHALRDLLEGCMASFDPLLEAAEAHDMLRKTGWLGLYETKAGFDGYQRSLEVQRRRGVRAEVIPAEELRQLEPALGASQRFHAGIYYPDVGYVSDSLGLVQVLARAFRQRGGRILREEVYDFEIGVEGPEAVLTDRGRHACDRLVIAAGAYSRTLARRLGSDPLLDTERGYSLTLPNPGVRPRMPVCSTERGQVCTPIDAGLRLAGTVELAGLDAPPDWRRADMLLENAQRWFPGVDGEGAVRWMGFRPSMPDSLPVISRSPRFANTVFAFGHGHCGLMLSARTGELVRDLTLDRPTGIDVSPFRVDRF